MRLSNKTKGILSLIGGFCLHFMNGSLYTWSSINSYFASYLHHHGQDITVEDLYFLMPCIFLVQYCFMTVGVKLGDTCGPRVTTIIGVFFMVGSYAFLIFFTNYYLVLLGMGLFGFGDGIANLSVINNGWKYFKKNKGLVNGIIIGGLGLSSSVLNPLADFMINPEKKGTEPDGFYSEKIANNLLDFLYVLVGIFVFLGIMAIALTFPYEEEIIPVPTEGLIQNEKGDSPLPPPPETSNTNLSKSNDTTTTHHEKKRVAFFSIVNFQLGIFCFCGPFFCFLLSNTNRAFGNKHDISQGYLQFMAFFFGLVNGSTRFIWGHLLDKLSYKMLMFIILFLELAVSVSVYYSVKEPILYLVENFVIALALSGTFTMITPTFHKVFGHKNGAKIYGLTGILIGIASFLGPVLTKIFIKKEEDYLKVYLVGAGSVFINIITLFFFKEEPFKYGRKDVDPLVEDVSIVKDILKNTENKPIDVSVDKPQE